MEQFGTKGNARVGTKDPGCLVELYAVFSPLLSLSRRASLPAIDFTYARGFDVGRIWYQNIWKFLKLFGSEEEKNCFHLLLHLLPAISSRRLVMTCRFVIRGENGAALGFPISKSEFLAGEERIIFCHENLWMKKNIFHSLGRLIICPYLERKPIN